jgi:hypothetical protein
MNNQSAQDAGKALSALVEKYLGDENSEFRKELAAITPKCGFMFILGGEAADEAVAGVFLATGDKYTITVAVHNALAGDDTLLSFLGAAAELAEHRQLTGGVFDGSRRN